MDKREQAGSFSINQNNVEEITKKLEQQMKRKDKIKHIKNILVIILK